MIKKNKGGGGKSTRDYGARGVIVCLNNSIERLDGGVNFCISAAAEGRRSVLAGKPVGNACSLKTPTLN
jgi:hypothetical protein